MTPPYKRPDLRRAWASGRRAGLSERKHLATSYALFQAWRRGFNEAAKETA